MFLLQSADLRETYVVKEEQKVLIWRWRLIEMKRPLCYSEETLVQFGRKVKQKTNREIESSLWMYVIPPV